MSKKKKRLSASELLALTREDGQLFHDAAGRPHPLPAAVCPLADTHGHLTHFHVHSAPAALARASLAGLGLLGVPLDPAGDGRDAAGVLAALDAWIEIAGTCVDELVGWGVEPAGEDAYALLGNVRIWSGVHPYGGAIFNAEPSVQASFRRLLESPLVAGVGEIGLDYGPYNRCDPEEQKKAFVAQLRVAHELGLPAQLHIRDAEGDELVQAHVDAALILEREGVPEAGCDLHCYTSNVEAMRPFVELGCYVAFGGVATFPRSEDVREAACACPAEQLLSETDSPYMAPVPLRGMECEPAMVAFSIDCVASAREQAGVATREETYRALWDNAQRLFGSR